jgi:hypothetical protein
MSVITPQHIESFLGTYGFEYSLTKARTWSTGWDGDRGHFPCEIQLKDTFLQMRVKPLFEDKIVIEDSPEICETLMRINSEIKLARVSIGSDDSLQLELDLLVASLDYGQFEMALGVLGYYTDMIHEEISQVVEFHEISTNPLTYS